MLFRSLKNLLAVAVVTNLVQPSLARQSAPQAVTSIKSAMVAGTMKPVEIKSLPLILDTKNFKIDKFNDVRIEKLDFKKVLGPRTGGGGNICAFNITAASALIVKNIHAVPFANQHQRRKFIEKINTLRFYQGANLEVRGQSVNAINYPLAGAVVLDEKACEYLDTNKIGGPAFLLHELLGAAGIDDTTYQVSSRFAQAVENNSLDAIYGTSVVTCQGDKGQLLNLSFAHTESGASVYKINVKNLTMGALPEAISGAIVNNGQETDNSTPSRIAFSSAFGEMVIITAPEPFAKVLEGEGASMDVVVMVEDLKSNSKCTRVN